MAVTINGTSGINTPGVVNTAAETVATTLAVAGAITGSGLSTTLYPLVSGTSVPSTSGVAVPIATGIPSWVKRVTVMLASVSTSGTSNPIFQLGTGVTPTYATSGYLGSGTYVSSSPSSVTYTTGFGLNSTLAANVLHGSVVFTNISGTTWVANGTFALSNNNVIMNTAGTIVLGAALTALQITTVGGANTFTAGSINILYE